MADHSADAGGETSRDRTYGGTWVPSPCATPNVECELSHSAEPLTRCWVEPVERIWLFGLAETPERARVAAEMQDCDRLVVLVGVKRDFVTVLAEPDPRRVVDAFAADIGEVGAPKERCRRYFHRRHILRADEQPALDGGLARPRPKDEAVAGDHQHGAPGRIFEPPQHAGDQRDAIALGRGAEIIEGRHRRESGRGVIRAASAGRRQTCPLRPRARLIAERDRLLAAFQVLRKKRAVHEVMAELVRDREPAPPVRDFCIVKHGPALPCLHGIESGLELAERAAVDGDDGSILEPQARRAWIRISAVAGSPRSPLSHTAVSASRAPAPQANPRPSLSLGCAAWPVARDMLNNARTNFNEPLSDGGEVRLVEGIGVWNGAGRRMQSSRRARFGRRHKCAIGPVHPYYTDELRFIRWHGNSPWSVS